MVHTRSLSPVLGTFLCFIVKYPNIWQKLLTAEDAPETIIETNINGGILPYPNTVKLARHMASAIQNMVKSSMKMISNGS